MGRSINKVQLIGILGQEPEKKYINSGTPVVNLSVATDESYIDKASAQKVEQTEWHRITVYGALADIVNQYLHKGSRVYFEGKLKTREWEKDGIKRYTTEIIATDMVMLDSKPQTQTQTQTQTQNQKVQKHQQQYQQPAQPNYAQQPPIQPPPATMPGQPYWQQPQGGHAPF